MTTTLSEEIKRFALELGFDLAGITTADPLTPHDRHLENWIGEQRHGKMRYMAERTLRAARPRDVVPGARSVIVVGMAYRWDRQPPDDGQPRGHIAACAWGTDYHRVMTEKLALLGRFLLDRGATVARSYVDTGPLLDRALAHRAGVGWFGKNTMLITRAGHGSYVFLGEVLTDLALLPDVPAQGSCGQCRICLDECPTGAIVAPFVVDARRCISYLTIELRGWIPRELRPLMGTWVFGCDICQDVCPHNVLVKRGLHAEFAPRRDVPFPDLVDLLHLDEPTYQERFRGSAIKRAKRQGLRRNAAVALGNLRDPRAIPALAQALADDDPIICGHAAWALGRIGGSQAQGALRERAQTEDDAAARSETDLALAECSPPPSPTAREGRP